MFYKNLILSVLWIFSNTVYAVCSNIPEDLTEPNYGVVQWLGGGYDNDRDRIKVMTCLNGNKVRETGNSKSEISVGLMTDYEEIQKEIKRKLGGKIKIGWFNFGGNRDFTQKITDKAYSQTFVLAFDAQTGNGRFDVDSNNPLNDLAKRVKSNACDFKKYCGDKFVFQTVEGAKLLIGIQISFSSNDQYEEYKKGFSAGVEGSISKTFNVCTSCGKVPLPINISFGGNVDKSLETITQTLRQQGKIEIFALQQGGDVLQLGNALSGNNAVSSCSLDNRAACLQMVENALTYLKASEFIDGVKTAPAVLNYAERPYWEVDPDVPNLVSEITPEIDNARQQLAQEFDQRLADQQTIQNTLALSLSPNRQTVLTQLKQLLIKETQALYQTGLLCFSDLANCPQKAAQTLSNLQAYNRTFLTPNPADGLVAYYPFNANALDESGNGNNGTVYGATLTKDRNGNPNSAYSFNGGSIRLPLNSANFSQNFSIAIWVKFDDFNNDYPHIMSSENSFLNFHGLGSAYGQNQSSFGFYLQNGNASSRNGSLISNLKLTPAQWYLLTINRDNLTFYAYANESLVNQVTDTQAIPLSGSYLTLGMLPVISAENGGLANAYLHGALDDLRIYNRALSDAEIKQLYETTETKLNQPPVAIFSSSNSSPSTVNVDASSSIDSDGTIQRYEWSTSNGQFATGKTATFSFSNAGNYAITLTITDDKGATSQAVKNLIIQGDTGNSCTNSTIANCQASFSFETGQLCIPCVSVPTPLGSQIYAAELNRINPLQLGFEVNPLTLKPHTFKDSCLATYTGILNVPCVQVGTTTYNVDFNQRSNSLIFDVSNVH